MNIFWAIAVLASGAFAFGDAAHSICRAAGFAAQAANYIGVQIGYGVFGFGLALILTLILVRKKSN